SEAFSLGSDLVWRLVVPLLRINNGQSVFENPWFAIDFSSSTLGLLLTFFTVFTFLVIGILHESTIIKNPRQTVIPRNQRSSRSIQQFSFFVFDSDHFVQPNRMAPPYPPVQKPRLHRSDFVHKPLARSSSDQNAPVTFLRRSDGRSLRTPTLTVHPTRNVNQPETLADLEALVKEAHENEKRRGSDPLPRTIELSKDKDPELDVALVLLLSIQICFSSKWSGATKDKPKYTTHDALKHLKEVIEKEATEQRWTAPSKSPISPAFSTAEDELFSWLYIFALTLLPSREPHQPFSFLLYFTDHLFPSPILTSPCLRSCSMCNLHALGRGAVIFITRRLAPTAADQRCGAGYHTGGTAPAITDSLRAITSLP
ncbi:unnamed protein product, partial [Brassica oleracea]